MGRRRRRRRHPRLYCPLNNVTCHDYDYTGKGLVYFNDKLYYVDEMIKGEVGKMIIYHEEDDFGTARAISLTKTSPERVLPLGHVKFSVGSYHLPHLSNQAQDDFKQQQVEKYFPQAKKIIVGKRTHYRNKVSLTNGGFMAPGRGRRKIVYLPDFDLCDFSLLPYQNDQGVTIIRKLETTIVGKPGTKLYTYDQLLGKSFRVGLDSFYQVNLEMARLAYQQIINFIPVQSVVFDLFSGIGVIGILVADQAKQVYSVEISEQSHLDNLFNIKLNHLTNVQAIKGDANQFVLNPPQKPNVIIVDPARAGLNEVSARAINQSQAKMIIYLSCNIITQARDLKILSNYQIIMVQPYDFFPQTYHIENLVILTLKSENQV